MAGVTTLVSRFPQQERALHRLRVRNGEFRAACEDYEAALTALRHWESLEPVPRRAREYRVLVVELEEEIMEMVEGKGDAL